VVNLHPVAIIVAILVFGGLWGFWGVFFAIPLGTLVKAVLTAWPRAHLREQREEARQQA
jgi:putative permease